MEQALLVIVGILGIGISVVVKLIFLCMDADAAAKEAEASRPPLPSADKFTIAQHPRPTDSRKRRAAARWR